MGLEPTVSADKRQQTNALGRGYIGTRTDTTQQPNICLGIHRQTRVATLNPTCLSRLIATAVVISPLKTTHETYAHCSTYLTRLSARNKPTSLAPNSRPLLGDNIYISGQPNIETAV